ncbi:MAG: DNA/RNA non-specific endonuclease [Spirochaetaceae bacterium]|nr:DNA/RNA non-specific endonuclease [Spirochaetaceae bacterium]
MEKRKNKAKKNIKTIVILVIVLLLLSILSLFFAPTEDEFNNRTIEKTVVTTTVSSSVEIPNLELPKPVKGEQIVAHTDYVLSYNEEFEQPSYVAYELDSNEIYGPAKRKNNFKADPSITTGSATLDDYKNSGYDRGHLCPAADQEESDKAMSDSFYMSNMSPQAPDFNRKIWADLEGTVRTFADTNGKIYITTGPILTDGPYKTIGKNEVAVPNYYYKVILDYTEPEIKSIGFILPNEGSDKSLQSFATTVDKVEERTGLDFFYQLPDDVEAKIESTEDPTKWVFKEFIASQGNGSFDPNAVIKANQPTTTSSNSTNSNEDIQVILKQGITYIMVRLRVETTKIISQFIPRETLKSLNII